MSALCHKLPSSALSRLLAHIEKCTIAWAPHREGSCMSGEGISTLVHRMINDVLRTSRRHRPSTRACARHGVLDFEQKCLRTNVEFVSMTTVVRCPRTGRACRDVTCRERHWCRQMLERGLSPSGLPLKRRHRPRCCAKTRAAAPCIMRVVPGKRRCRFHGGLSTGPRTVEGRTRIAETQRRRWRAFRDVSTRADAEKAAGELSGTVLERARSRVG